MLMRILKKFVLKFQEDSGVSDMEVKNFTRRTSSGLGKRKLNKTNIT